MGCGHEFGGEPHDGERGMYVGNFSQDQIFVVFRDRDGSPTLLCEGCHEVRRMTWTEDVKKRGRLELLRELQELEILPRCGG